MLFIGKEFDITFMVSLVKGIAGMNQMTALCFIALGSALIAFISSPENENGEKLIGRSRSKAVLFYLFSAAVIVTGLLRLAEYVTGIPLSLAHLVSEKWVWENTMAPNTAFNFVILGAALVVLRWKNNRNIIISQTAGLLAGFIALLTLIGYIYSQFAFTFLNIYFPPMALNTALVFLILSAGILFIYPYDGFVCYISDKTNFGRTVRMLVPAAVLFPVVIGWLRLYGERIGLYDNASGTTLFSWIIICAFITIIIFSARRHIKEDRLREQTEKRIAESELILKAIIDNSPAAITLKDLEGRYILVNREVEKIMGTTMEALKGKSVFDLHSDEIANGINKHDKMVMEAGKAMSYEEKIILNGTDHTFFSQKFPLYDINDKMYAICGISSDITERKQIEEQVRESKEQIETIFENAPNAVVVINEEGVIIRWNSEADSVFGWKAEEVHGKPMHELIMPLHYRDAHINGLKRFLETGKATIINKSLELAALRKNGEEFPIELRISDTTLGGKHIFIAFINDITERKLAEKAIAESELRLRSIIDNSPVVITMKDLKGRFIMVNKEAERVLGKTLTELKGKTVYDFYPYEGANIVNENDKSVRETGRLMEYEEKVFLDGEVHTFLSMKFPLKGIDNKIYATCGISTDITERKNSEQNLHRLNGQLYESNKELESFSYSVSHDLRAPLRHIIGFGEKLKRETAGKSGDEEQRLMGKILGSANKMALLIDDLLMFSKVGRTELNIKSVDMNSLFSQVIEDQKQDETTYNITWNTGKLCNINGDLLQLGLVVQNLISNAVKYTEKKNKRTIDIGSYPENGETVFYVKDNGAGFDMRYADKLFGVFQRLHKDNEYSGTGIGLATVRRIINRHGGRTWAEGELDKGASFYFTLPN